jgi:hypothetical protein
VRVLFFHPWGRFDPAYCGASRTASVQWEYAQTRCWDVHLVAQEVPAWGLFAPDDEALKAQFPDAKSIRTVRLDCPPVAPRRYGDEFCHLLYAAERAAHNTAFCEIASQPWDAFFTTDVTAAPFAAALPRTVLKVLAVGDGYARRAARVAHAQPALRDAEERFAFARIEAELYRLFERVQFPSEADARAARQHGVKVAVHVPPLIEAAAPAPDETEEHDLLIRAGERSGDRADLDWFYRHVYLPHLRQHGVRLTVAGPGAARFPVPDLCVTKSPAVPLSSARLVVAPVCEVAGPHPMVTAALATGRALVTTPLGVSGLDVPDDSAAVIDMRQDPAGTAAVIRDLLAAPGWRRTLGERAAGICRRHTRERHFAALDELWASPTRSRITLAGAL